MPEYQAKYTDENGDIQTIDPVQRIVIDNGYLEYEVPLGANLIWVAELEGKGK